MGKRRRTEIAKIADPAARLVTYSKRRKGLFNKASELCRLCGARAAVVVFSPAGKPCYFGDPSADEIIARYLRTGEAMPPMGLTEWAEWVETELDGCATEEGLESLILKYEAVRDRAREKLKALEDVSQDKVGAVHSHVLTDEEEMDSMFESLEGQGPGLSALLMDGEGFSTSLENSAGGGGNLAANPTPVPSDLGVSGFDAEDFLNLHDGEGFLVSPEDSAVGGGNLAVEPTPAPSDLENSGFDPDDFLNLMEDCEGFSTSLEDSAGGGRNLTVDPTSVPSDLGDSGFDPDEFLNLLEDGEGFLTSPEEYWAVSGGSSAADADLADSKSWTSGCEFSYSYMYSVPRVTCLEDILCLP